VQQDGSYLGCTGNRLTYGPARRRIGSDNGRSRISNFTRRRGAAPGLKAYRFAFTVSSGG
jgi:hypothetical protein